jgi:hypothetical protein
MLMMLKNQLDKSTISYYRNTALLSNHIKTTPFE